MTFSSTIRTAFGDLIVEVPAGATTAYVCVDSGRDTVTVTLGGRGLKDLASASAAVAHGSLNEPAEIDTEAGVDRVGQPAGLITMSPRDGGADVTVNDNEGHIVEGWIDSTDCSRLSISAAAASNDL